MLFPEAQAIDAKLDRWNRAMDFLLHLTPINVAQAWRAFHNQKKNPTAPRFAYRPMSCDLDGLVGGLEQLDIEGVPEPHFRSFLQQQREWLLQKAAMLQARNTAEALPASRAMYGEISPQLVESARQVLDFLPPRVRGEERRYKTSAHELAAQARQEIEAYRALWPGFAAQVEIREEVEGILVSQGDLLIGASYTTPIRRVEALLHHEIGTHCVSYANGSVQPFVSMAEGLARYEALQEGLAVLAEHLCGGLRRPRLRLLAGRVLAAQSVEQGGSWLDTFYLLHQDHGFAKALAFNITMRVHRGGGFLKDAIYLRGLLELLEYLQRGGPWLPLWVGKIGFQHLPWVEAGLAEGWLKNPVLQPLYLSDAQAQRRLERVRRGIPLARLVTP